MTMHVLISAAQTQGLSSTNGNHCGGKHYHEDEVEMTENSWLSKQLADFFVEGYQKWIVKYKKCLNNQHNYVGKLKKNLHLKINVLKTVLLKFL